MPYVIESHEFKLALSCSALDKDGALVCLKNAIDLSQFNEKLFLSILTRHHLLELAYQTLLDNPFLSIHLKNQLKRQFDFNQIKSIKSLSTHVKLQTYFNQKQIDAIFLKGILVSHLYYGDIGRRNLVDIDVWVPKNHFDEVKSFLKTLGYYSIIDRNNWNEKQVQYIRRYSHDEIFLHINDATAPAIELHWKIRNFLGNFMFDPIQDQHHLMKVELGGVQFSIFNHEDQFIFLCVHGAEHGWFKVKWLVDLYHLVNTVDLDWSRISLRASELRSIIEVRIACRLLADVYGFKMSDKISIGHLTIADRFRLRYIKHMVSYDGIFCDTPREKLRNVLYTLSLNRRFLIPKELILKNLTNPTDWLTLPLPQYLFFLYFPLRPFLWLFRKIKSKI